MTIWNVTIQTCEADNGFCLSYKTEEEARKAYQEAKEDGTLHVTLWKC